MTDACKNWAYQLRRALTNGDVPQYNAIYVNNNPGGCDLPPDLPPPVANTPYNCAAALDAWKLADTPGQAAIVAAMKQNNCTNIPSRSVQTGGAGALPGGYKPPPVVKPTCDDLIAAVQTALDANDEQGAKNAYNTLVQSSIGMKCTIPSDLVKKVDNFVASHPDLQPPAPTPCDTSALDSLSAADYLFKLPLLGIKDEPILGLLIAAGGGIGAYSVGQMIVPELMPLHYVRWPVLAGGAYAGLVVNGILDNYQFISSIKNKGVIVGSLVTTLGIVRGTYASIHNGIEGFSQGVFGKKLGEIVYKGLESPFGIASDILFKDQTWKTKQYTALKCANNCGNPSLNEAERSACKLLSRFDIHWKF